MKNTILSLAAAFALLASTPASAASTGGQDGPGRNDNYGYDRNHRVTPQERAKWEAQHRNDHHDDKNDRHDDKNDRHDDKKDRHDDKKDHDKNDRGNNGNGRGNGRDTNYGYDRGHQVTPGERAAWEAQHKNDHR